MRKALSITTAALLLSVATFAQTNKEEVDIIQSIFGKEKKAIMASFVQLDPTTQNEFWSLYDQYETERKALGRDRIALLERYAQNYATLDDEATDKLIKDLQKLQASTDKLLVKYYGKMKKASSVKSAAQFFQLESYLLTMVRAAILDSIPMIGELDGFK
jgi:DNA-directed RNA polymerase subunit F